MFLLSCRSSFLRYGADFKLSHNVSIMAKSVNESASDSVSSLVTGHYGVTWESTWALRSFWEGPTFVVSFTQYWVNTEKVAGWLPKYEWKGPPFTGERKFTFWREQDSEFFAPGQIQSTCWCTVGPDPNEFHHAIHGKRNETASWGTRRPCYTTEKEEQISCN